MSHSIHRQKLANGIEVAFIDVPAQKTVHMAIYILGGQRSVKAAQYHLPHILEHLVYSGSENYPQKRDLLEVFEGEGGYTNAMTSGYFNKFEFIITEKEMNAVVPAAFDMVYRPLLEDQAFEIEKGIVQNEILENADSIYPAMQIADANLLTPDLIPILELQLADLERIDRGMVADFHAERYNVENTKIMIAGSLTAKERAAYIKLLEQHTKQIPKGKPARPSKRTVEKDFAGVYPMELASDDGCIIQVTFNMTESVNDSRFAALNVFDSLITGGLSGVLSSKFRDEGFTYNLQSNPAASMELTSFEFIVNVPANKLARFMYVFSQELQAVLHGLFTDKEFERAKRLVTRGLTDSTFNASDLVGWYEMEYVLDRPLVPPEGRVAEVEAVKRADIENLKELFSYDNAIVLFATSNAENYMMHMLASINRSIDDAKFVIKLKEHIAERGIDLQEKLDLVYVQESQKWLNRIYSYVAVSVLPLLYFAAAYYIFVPASEMEIPFGLVLATLPMALMAASKPRRAWLKFLHSRLFWIIYGLSIFGTVVQFALGLHGDILDIVLCISLLPMLAGVVYLMINGSIHNQRYWQALAEIMPFIKPISETQDAAAEIPNDVTLKDDEDPANFDAVRVSFSVTQGKFSAKYGELWLTKKGILRVGLTFKQSTDAYEQNRKFQGKLLQSKLSYRLLEDPNNLFIARNQVTSFKLKRTKIQGTLEIHLADGKKHRFTFLKDDMHYDVLRRTLEEWVNENTKLKTK